MTSKPPKMKTITTLKIKNPKIEIDDENKENIDTYHFAHNRAQEKSHDKSYQYPRDVGKDITSLNRNSSIDEFSQPGNIIPCSKAQGTTQYQVCDKLAANLKKNLIYPKPQFRESNTKIPIKRDSSMKSGTRKGIQQIGACPLVDHRLNMKISQYCKIKKNQSLMDLGLRCLKKTENAGGKRNIQNKDEYCSSKEQKANLVAEENILNKDEVADIRIEEDVLSSTTEYTSQNPSVSKFSHCSTSSITSLSSCPTPKSPSSSMPQIPFEYISDIYMNLKQEETNEEGVKVNHLYMTTQSEINEQMRAILIDWIIEVHNKFKLSEETLFLTVNLIDRFLSQKLIARSRLQLLGVAALMVACKHEEIYMPHVSDFVYITDHAYTQDQVFEMEIEILQTLKFSLLTASPMKFYEILSLNFNFNSKLFYLGRYLMEVFLVDYRMTKYFPSIIACACVYIVMKYFKLSNYSQIYDKKFYSENPLNENQGTVLIKECAKEICFLVDNIEKCTLTAAKRKFGSKDFESVSNLSFN